MQLQFSVILETWLLISFLSVCLLLCFLSALVIIKSFYYLYFLSLFIVYILFFFFICSHPVIEKYTKTMAAYCCVEALHSSCKSTQIWFFLSVGRKHENLFKTLLSVTSSQIGEHYKDVEKLSLHPHELSQLPNNDKPFPEKKDFIDTI